MSVLHLNFIYFKDWPLQPSLFLCCCWWFQWSYCPEFVSMYEGMWHPFFLIPNWVVKVYLLCCDLGYMSFFSTYVFWLKSNQQVIQPMLFHGKQNGSLHWSYNTMGKCLDEPKIVFIDIHAYLYIWLDYQNFWFSKYLWLAKLG